MRLGRPGLRPAILAVGLAHLALACSGPTAPRLGDEDLGVVVTQVPADNHRPVQADALEPTLRYPVDSRVVWVPAIGGSDEPRVLSRGLAAAGAPYLSPEADTVVFAGRERPTDRWAIYRVKVRGGAPRPVARLNTDCTDPALLAGGRLVFRCVDPGAQTTVWSLYTSSADGSAVERITFGPGSALAPTALDDGRILFSMQQGLDRSASESGAVGLFTINPDGTMLEAFSGSHRTGELKLRPRVTVDGGVVFVSADSIDGVTGVGRTELGRPESGRSNPPVAVQPLTVETIAVGELLIAGFPGTVAESRQGAAVFRWSAGGGGPQRVFDQQGWNEIEAVPAIRRSQPRGRPSAIDHGKKTGSLLCYDAGRSDGRVGPSDAAPKPTAVQVMSLKEALGASIPVNLGQREIESDGSFLVELPADTPLRIRTFSDNGLQIAESDWFWLRPGEVRSCFGCHESREAAPVNRPIQALSRPIVRLLAAAQETAG